MLQKIFTIFSIILMSVNSAYLQHSENAINFSDYIKQYNKQYSDDELNEAMSEQGIQKAFETYKSKGGSASQDSFASQWKPLIGRMLEGFTNNMGVAIAEEKYKRNNPFWDPRD